MKYEIRKLGPFSHSHRAEGQVELSISVKGRRPVPGVALHCLGSHTPKYHPTASSAGQETQFSSLPGPARKAGVETAPCLQLAFCRCLWQISCYGLIVLILQHEPPENTCGHTKAPKTWRSVAFCGVSPAHLNARGLQMLPVPKLLCVWTTAIWAEPCFLHRAYTAARGIFAGVFFLSQKAGGLAIC